MNSSQQRSISMEQLLRHQACPMTASVSDDPRDDMKSDVARWYSYFNKLPLAIRWGLVDEEIIRKVLILSRKYKINDEFKIGEISRIIRENFFKPSSEQQLRLRILEKLEIQDDRSDVFLQEIKVIIDEVESIGNQHVLEITEKIPIIPALKKFPLLRKQVIAKKNIKMFESKEFVTSSVGNWIDDYIQRKGAQAHNNIQRSDYIFNSENGLKLDTEDRKKVGIVLESYDNDNSLDVNTENQELLFSQGFKPEKKIEKPAEALQPRIIEEQQKPPQDNYFQELKKAAGGAVGKGTENADEKQYTDNKINLEEQKQEIPGPPQPYVDVIPEKETPLQQWKDKNVQSMKGFVPSSTEVKLNNQTQNQEISEPQGQNEKTVNISQGKKKEEDVNSRKQGLPYEKTQEIGWFGESTGVDEVSNRKKSMQDNFIDQAQKKGESKERAYGRPHAVTRNYREVDNVPKNKSKHIINLKEVV